MADDVDKSVVQFPQKKEETMDEKIAAINEKLKHEVSMWELGGIDPANITINAFLQDVWIFALRDFMVEKGLIDEKEMLLFYKERLLGKLQEFRPMALNAVQEAKKQIAMNPLLGPDGQPLN